MTEHLTLKAPTRVTSPLHPHIFPFTNHHFNKIGTVTLQQGGGGVIVGACPLSRPKGMMRCQDLTHFIIFIWNWSLTPPTNLDKYVFKP